MIIKPLPPVNAHIQKLEEYLQLPYLTPLQRRDLESDIRKRKAGWAAEKDAAYQIGLQFHTATNIMVLHDLRFDVDGYIVQIDHLLLNRFLEFILIETKSFAEGLAINAQDEFTRFYNGKPQGMASPYAQSLNHITLFKRFLSARVNMPKRLGIALSPSFVPFVAVSSTARIQRPAGKLSPAAASIMKIDQIKERYNDLNTEDTISSAFSSMAKLVSADTIKAIALELAACHTPPPLPSPPETTSRFSPPDIATAPPPAAPPSAAISAPPTPTAPAPEPAPTSALSPTTPSAAPSASTNSSPVESSDTKQAKWTCAVCSTSLPYPVAKFCWTQKTKFNNQLLCRDHQPK